MPLELLTIETIWCRPCFICGRCGACEHRELEVAQAIIDGHQSKQARLAVGVIASALLSEMAMPDPDHSPLLARVDRRPPARAIAATLQAAAL